MDGPTNQKGTLAQVLFEFVEFVTNRKKPKVGRPVNSEQDLIHRLNILLKSNKDIGEDDDYMIIKSELRKAINVKTQAMWEEQRVQVPQIINRKLLGRTYMT